MDEDLPTHVLRLLAMAAPPRADRRCSYTGWPTAPPLLGGATAADSRVRARFVAECAGICGHLAWPLLSANFAIS
ncbi:hypothetical protein QYE76_037454 [Lolium multiflorum]|uniref:Uncharacterized protein n=1 Tax=Lolium multiflorum TaxID=4521 RepID=A0AAD8QGT8_LOLMU|nr:hypothetical protein QYE76_037454 [Lolium multiflorum]